MDLKQTSLVLKKINRLHELINTIGEASSTETDLLKAYIVDLYEAVAMSDIEEITDLDEEEMVKKIKKQKKVEKKLKKKVNKKAVVEDVEEEEVEEIVEHVEEDIHIEEEEISAPEVVEVENEPAVEPAPVIKTAEPVIDSALVELFDFSMSAELSDKLANAPIKDLTKAMGINERIFTANELFAGDQKEMDNILLALNGLDTFDEAKSVLMHSVAQKNNWAEGSKVKKAKNFIKLIKRRYN